MKRLIFIVSFFISVLFSSCSHGQVTDYPNASADTSIIPAAYLTNTYLPLIQDKRIALVVNQTSVIESTHLVDTLTSLNIDIKKVFAPEHGFRGQADAGETVDSGKDAKTGLPIVSLYGSNKKPSPTQLEDVDVVVFDIQDVGTRFYTYISTMHYVMEACAELGKQVIILDRPNPNGMFVDGPVLDMEFQSFVGMHPIPILHGLTVGELAKMINGEQWLTGGDTCNIRVIAMENYKHSDQYDLPVKPSPNLPNALSIQLYASLCLFEGTVVSVGRGTLQPFQQIGHPDFKDLPHQFTPKSIEGMAKHPKYENTVCYGISFDDSTNMQGFDLQYLLDFYERYKGDDFFNNYFNTLAGTDELKKQIMEGKSESEIRASWKNDLEKYKTIRKKYLIYAE